MLLVYRLVPSLSKTICRAINICSTMPPGAWHAFLQRLQGKSEPCAVLLIYEAVPNPSIKVVAVRASYRRTKRSWPSRSARSVFLGDFSGFRERSHSWLDGTGLHGGTKLVDLHVHFCRWAKLQKTTGFLVPVIWTQRNPIALIHLILVEIGRAHV